MLGGLEVERYVEEQRVRLEGAYKHDQQRVRPDIVLYRERDQIGLFEASRFQTPKVVSYGAAYNTERRVFWDTRLKRGHRS